ncbi:acyltransferase [Riemerella anatipestifer]|uniref:acyltransferase n=1 Tax=Riemerella anatipestifer TaxID=34085 RepID=UPI003DA9941A
MESIYWKSYYGICKRKGLVLGDGVVLRNGIDFGSEPFLIEINENSRVAKGVSFVNHSGGQMLIRCYEGYNDVRNFGRIKIGKNCFIGMNSIIQPNVHVGDNCIIGAGSLVTTSTLPNAVYGGVPAKYICSLNEYLEKKKKESVLYPRELEENRKELERYIAKNLPHIYKPVKK